MACRILCSCCSPKLREEFELSVFLLHIKVASVHTATSSGEQDRQGQGPAVGGSGPYNLLSSRLEHFLFRIYVKSKRRPGQQAYPGLSQDNQDYCGHPKGLEPPLTFIYPQLFSGHRSRARPLVLSFF